MSGIIINPYTYAASFSNTKSLIFDGVDAFVDVYDGSSGSGPFLFEAGDSFSFSAWIKVPLSAGANNFIMCFRGASMYTRLYTFVTGSNIRLHWAVRDNSSNNSAMMSYNSSDGWIPADTWTHVVATRDGAEDEQNIYINATKAQVTKTDTTSDDLTAYYAFTLGNDNLASGPRYYFDGNQDEVALFDYALSGTNVTSLYNLGEPTNLADFGTPPIWWLRMGDEGEYPNFPDQIGSNDGTAENMVSGDVDPDVPPT